jgi:hypothetical protein
MGEAAGFSLENNFTNNGFPTSHCKARQVHPNNTAFRLLQIRVIFILLPLSCLILQTCLADNTPLDKTKTFLK